MTIPAEPWFSRTRTWRPVSPEPKREWTLRSTSLNWWDEYPAIWNGKLVTPVPVGVEPSESRTSTTPFTVVEFVFTTLTLTRLLGSGSRPSMYMAKSSIPKGPPIIGIDWGDIG